MGPAVIEKKAPVFERLALIGVGLIGSSIARAARATGAASSIVATSRSVATRKRVAELGIADRVVETNAEAAKGADLVIVCAPVGVVTVSVSLPPSAFHDAFGCENETRSAPSVASSAARSISAVERAMTAATTRVTLLESRSAKKKPLQEA